MEVIKRNGQREGVDFNKITNRLEKLKSEMIPSNVDPIKIAQKVCTAIYHGVSTQELDNLSAEISQSLSTEDPSYGTLAAYIQVSNLHKNTCGNFKEIMEQLYENGILSDEMNRIIEDNKERIVEKIVYSRDYYLDYFGLKTLERSYLHKMKGSVIERPQDMWMRVSLGIHGNDLESAFETYDLMSNKFFTHATPTLFNAGTKKPQMSSCFLMAMKDDSIKGIYDTLSDCAQISKYAGGIGLHIHNLRGTGSKIGDVESACTGIVPVMRVYNATARYVNQGGRRPGSIAIYLSVEHPDIQKFLQLKKNHGDEEERARDLFYAVWIPDLFMERVKTKSKWSLFCPNIAPGLNDLVGDAYKQKYEEYEDKGMFTEQIDAQKLWSQICSSQIETGTPYILYKDACNKKSNHKNIGVIKSSNLCTEILQYSSPTETAVCNLASIALPKFVNISEYKKTFDFEYLHKVTKIVTRNLNKVIDRNYYPIKEAFTSNMKHRPIGIGVQGLADVYMIMNYPFESDEAKTLNKNIFETIYHGAMEASMELSRELGPYESYEGSPISEGIFQFDMWKVTPEMYDWSELKRKVKEYGVRNSLLVAPMPTASTSQILGNTECIEPITSNIYLRRTLAGEFIVINKHLIEYLIKIQKWDENTKNQIIKDNGSVMNLDIPEHMKNVYKTVWEIKQKTLIDQSADRGAYVCQSQSLNLFVKRPDLRILSSMHFYSWEKGLKTGMYYLRTQPVTNAIQFTLKPKECETCSS